MKQVLSVQRHSKQHWVGDGFPVRTLFSYQTHAKQISPFLLLDHAGPAEFAPSTHPRGVGQHPHRGFETVTIVYKGEVSHRDSTGQGGTIGPGDVQWMTAGSGILHEEFHSQAFTQLGGTLEMIQLWVNLPAQHKMTAPAYQAILAANIPTVPLPNGEGLVRVIAGHFDNHAGPAHVFSPMQVWDVAITGTNAVDLPAQEGWNTALVVMHGDVQINGQHAAHPGELVVLDAKGQDVLIQSDAPAKLVFLSGEPLQEPVVGHGPFVMNTREEIQQAIHDFNNGHFGQIKT